jgi:hypothetical protein
MMDFQKIILRHHIINLFLGIAVMLITSNLAAQDTGQGEIEKVEIVIEKNKQITLPQALRNFEKVPPRPSEPIKPEIVYNYKNVPFAASQYNPSIRPLKLKTEPINKLYGNYISAGYGNYASPFLEGYITNKRDKNKLYGAKLFHQSFGNGPVGESNSASGSTELKIFGRAFSRAVAVGGEIDYENRSAKFYGTLPGTFSGDASGQSYSVISLSTDVENATPSNFNYNLKGGFSYLKDDRNSTETELAMNLKSNLKVGEGKQLIIESDYFLMNRSFGGDARARHLFKVTPSYAFSPIENLDLKVGFNATFQNDTLGSVKSVNLYPAINASYKLTDKVQLYAALTGGIDRVSLHLLSKENIWLDQNVMLNNTNRAIEFSGGLQGKLAGKIAFQTGFSFASLKNLYFYQNDIYKGINPSNRPERFVVAYDDATRTNFFAEASVAKANQFSVLLRGDYFAYSTDKLLNAWHRPTYKLNVISSYNLYNKIRFDVDFTIQGGAKANSMERVDLLVGYVNKVVSLPVATDLNIKGSYSLSDQVNVFIKCNNVLGSQYQTYLYYPVRGFQALVGFSWSF